MTARILILSLFLSAPTFAITTIEELDEMAVFIFSIVSDNKGLAPGSNDDMSKADAWSREAGTDFIIGLGDHLVGGGDRFIDYVEDKSNTLWHDNFYPNVADGENQAFGGSQGAYDEGYKMLDLVELRTRPNVTMGIIRSEYYAQHTVENFTVHIIQLHYSDSGPGLKDASKVWMEETLKSIDKGDRDIIVVGGHSTGGNFPENGNLSSSQKSTLYNKADLILSATTHKPGRWNTGTAALSLNTGSVGNTGHESGFLQVHVLDHPPRMVIQLHDVDEQSGRVLHNPDARPIEKHRFVYIVDLEQNKVLEGSSEINWGSLESVPPNVGPPASLAVTANPTALANDGSTAEVSAVVKDASGYTVRDFTDPITFTVSAGGTIVGTNPVTPVNGKAVAEVSRQAGNITVTAEAGTLTGSVEIQGIVNLIENWSFEVQGTSAADAAGWEQLPGHERSSEEANTGTWSMKSTSDGSNSSVTVPVEAGVTYTITGYIMNKSGANAAIDMNDIPGELTLTSSSQNWNKVSGTWTNTANLSEVTLRVLTDGGNSSAYFDDIQMLGPGDEGPVGNRFNGRFTHTFQNDDITVSSYGLNRNIKFFTSEMAHVTLSLFDSQGRFLQYVHKGMAFPGSHTINLETASYEPGIYYLRGYAGKNELVKQFLIMK